MSEASYKLSQIGQIAVTAHELDRAVAFYRDTLGLPLLMRFPHLAFFDCAGVRLMLGVPERPEFDHPASVIYYKVEDIQAAHQALSARGVVFRDQPHLIARLPDHELWMAFFEDTEGNTLGLMSEVRP
ncbi:MAG TPA: VOC family protein [Chloroflexota bacterium]|jgi:predicted enzyme related to lactoylglutathione lyase|nr:VOC family protein [Chloroflexota bacterium]